MSDDTKDETGRDVTMVVLASYPSRQLAEQQYTVLRNMEKERLLELVDLAVVMKDEHGKTGVVRELHHPVHKGLVVGALLAVLPGVGLAAGLLAGALGGKMAGVAKDDLGHKTMRELGEFAGESGVLLVVVAPPGYAEAVRDTLGEATAIMSKTIDLSTGEVVAAAQEDVAAAESGGADG